MKKTLLILTFLPIMAQAQSLTLGPAPGKWASESLEMHHDTVVICITVGVDATTGMISDVDMGPGYYQSDVWHIVQVNGKTVDRGKQVTNGHIFMGTDGKPHPKGTRIKAWYLIKPKRV